LEPGESLGMGFNSTATAVTSTAVTSKDFGQALSVKPLEGGSSSMD
jgi:hypothetical protein